MIWTDGECKDTCWCKTCTQDCEECGDQDQETGCPSQDCQWFTMMET